MIQLTCALAGKELPPLETRIKVQELLRMSEKNWPVSQLSNYLNPRLKVKGGLLTTVWAILVSFLYWLNR